MSTHPLLRPVLDDEALTRGLLDPEARLLVEWLAEYGERLLERGLEGDEGVRLMAERQRRGRAVARFVELWCYRGSRKGALQLAAAERADWPLPAGPADPCELMQEVLDTEGDEPHDPEG
jgi:hypothetical protein